MKGRFEVFNCVVIDGEKEKYRFYKWGEINGLRSDFVFFVLFLDINFYFYI